MSNSARLDLDRLSVTSGAILLGIASTRFLAPSGRLMSATALGSRLGLNLTLSTISLLILTGMAITASASLVRSHPLFRGGVLRNTLVFWIVPGLLVLGLAAWSTAMDDLVTWIGLLVAGAILIPSSLALEYASVNPERRQDALVLWAETALIYMTALLLFSRIVDLRARTLLTGPAVLVVTTLLSGRLFWTTSSGPGNARAYALAVGFMIGLFNWVLSYWATSTLFGGMLLFIGFYAMVGLIQQHLQGRFGRQVVLEYIGLGVLVLAVIFWGLGS